MSEVQPYGMGHKQHPNLNIGMATGLHFTKELPCHG